MRNKIFLTSIIAMMVVNAPAFADDEVFPTGGLFGVGHTEYGNYTYGNQNNSDWNGYIGLQSGSTSVTTAAACMADPLRFEGTTPDSGTFTFTALYEAKHYNVIYKRDATSCGTAQTGVTDSYNSSTNTGGVEYDGSYTIKAVGSQSGDSGVTIPDGYTFSNWIGTSTGLYNGTQQSYTNALTESNRTYSAAATINPYKIEGDLTLTAYCTANDYYVTYSCNCDDTNVCSGTAPTDVDGSNNPVPHTVNSSVTLEQNGTGNCVKQGYTFSGWDCYRYANGTTGAAVTVTGSYDSSPNATSSGQSITMPPSDVLCKANWGDANGYKITYVCGTNPITGYDVAGNHPADTPVTFNSAWALPVSAGQCSDTGIHFIGWKCERTITTGSAYNGNTANYPLDTTGNVITGGSGVAGTGTGYGYEGNIECTAMWEANTINLVWDTVNASNDAAVQSNSPETCVYGTAATASTGAIKTVQQPNKPGYTFKGWKVTNHQ